jgi:outer membrane lipoprotein LolB
VNIRLAACAVALLATGCATLPEAGSAGDWPARRTALQSLERWTLDGRMAVAAGSEGFSGGLSWRQDGAQAAIELRAPLGGGAIAIDVAGEAITVTDRDGTTLAGEDARRLVARHIGTTLPVAELRYWLLGVPAPGSPHRESLGADRRLASLEQSGWRIGYTAYRGVGEVVLPSRLEITTDGLRLRVLIADWRLGP